MTSSKRSILVLGGVGFVGRHFVHYVVQNDLADHIRVVDKVLPQTAYLSAAHRSSFEKVDFRQGNLINATSVANCFTKEDGSEYDYVFNFAAETKYSQVPEVYQERIYQLSVGCAKEAAKRHVKAYVTLSSSEIYDCDQGASKEGSKIKPWTEIAKYKLKAEEELSKIEGLNLIIMRPAVIYGPGALLGLTPRLIIGRVYQHLGEEMKLLWSKDLRLNTVHVSDVVRAAWHVAEWYEKTGRKAEDTTPIFNLADKQNTDQEAINKLLQDIFGIKTGYYGSVVSSFAKLNLDSVTEDVNEKHLAPWAALLKSSNIHVSPLSPYLDQELLYNHALSVDGSKIERETGFIYSVPYLTKEKLVEVIDHFKALNVWPADEK
ncbi:hypothetical protein BX666DRAFT_1927480 [Dichotomocladium elegans]|nr:hypothetical protein BX666DRAFT_1927480 [Dichotomocladium elegans]